MSQMSVAPDARVPAFRTVITSTLLGADDPLTLEALGARMSVSKERVRQIEQAALTRLRGFIEAEVGDPVAAGLGG